MVDTVTLESLGYTFDANSVTIAPTGNVLINAQEVFLLGKDATGIDTGGSVSIGAGASPNGYAGTLVLTAGDSTDNDGIAGDTLIKGGQSQAGTPGGTYVAGGNAVGGTNDGGNLYLRGGSSAGGTRGRIILEFLPTADPTVAGAIWSDAGTLKISAG